MRRRSSRFASSPPSFLFLGRVVADWEPGEMLGTVVLLVHLSVLGQLFIMICQPFDSTRCFVRKYSLLLCDSGRKRVVDHCSTKNLISRETGLPGALRK